MTFLNWIMKKWFLPLGNRVDMETGDLIKPQWSLLLLLNAIIFFLRLLSNEKSFPFLNGYLLSLLVRAQI